MAIAADAKSGHNDDVSEDTRSSYWMSVQDIPHRMESMKTSPAIEQALFEKHRILTPDKQQEVLEFAASLEGKGSQDQPQASFIGMYSDQGVHITDEDIADARREMWSSFPREDR